MNSVAALVEWNGLRAVRFSNWDYYAGFRVYVISRHQEKYADAFFGRGRFEEYLTNAYNEPFDLVLYKVSKFAETHFETVTPLEIHKDIETRLDAGEILKGLYRQLSFNSEGVVCLNGGKRKKLFH